METSLSLGYGERFRSEVRMLNTEWSKDVADSLIQAMLRRAKSHHPQTQPSKSSSR